MSDRRSRRKPKKKTKILPVLFLIVLVVAFATGFFTWKETAGTKNGETVTVTIPQGAGAVTIATTLEEEGVIGNTFIFRMYLRFTGELPNLHYGNFELRENMPYAEIIESLKQKNTERETATVTFPEGATLIQFAQRMEDAGLCTKEEFIEVAVNGDFSEFEFFANISDNPDKFLKTEGFLFPDTYEFFVDDSVEDMVRRIYANFDAKITPEMYARMDELGMTLEEVITLASYIQEEAGDPINMGDVSAVMHNRLAEGSPYPALECDVSWHYIYDFIEPYYGGANNTPAHFYTAYDSYTVIGLPLPISNPGIEAINAALYPTENSPYYFFVTDLTGHYYYAVTFAEHTVNIAAANRVNATVQ